MDSFFGIGLGELFFIAIIALVVLGPERLPGAIREVVKFMRQVRSLTTDLTSQFSNEMKALEDLNPQKILQELTDEVDGKKSVANKNAPAKSTTGTAAKPAAKPAPKPTTAKATTAAKPATTTAKPAAKPAAAPAAETGADAPVVDSETKLVESTAADAPDVVAGSEPSILPPAAEPSVKAEANGSATDSLPHETVAPVASVKQNAGEGEG